MKGLDLDLGIGRAKSICLFNIDLSSLELIGWTRNTKCIKAFELGVSSGMTVGPLIELRSSQ